MGLLSKVFLAFLVVIVAVTVALAGVAAIARSVTR